MAVPPPTKVGKREQMSDVQQKMGGKSCRFGRGSILEMIFCNTFCFKRYDFS